MNEAFDVIVVGSGAGGLATAATAALLGARVVVLEKSNLIGGTTATSGGEIWIPRSRQAIAAGIADDADAVETYIRSVAGCGFHAPRTRRFIDAAPDALAFFEQRTHLRYALMPGSPDYHSERPGACSGGRSLAAEPFDGRKLGKAFELVRKPLENAMIAGGTSVCTRLDMPRLLRAGRHPLDAAYAAGLVARNWRDRLAGFSRGTRMTNGNALVGRLLLTLLQAGVEIRLNQEVTGLCMVNDRVDGVEVRTAGHTGKLRAERAVVLAAGGFSQSDALKARLFPHVARSQQHVSLPPETNTGDSIRIAQLAGAGELSRPMQPAAWAPISRVPADRGRTAPFPHFGDKGKPGVIAVDLKGRRFVNEAESYHAFVLALLAANETAEAAEAWLIADHRALRAYGLGAVRPYPWSFRPHLRSGYLRRGGTVAELASQIGIDPSVLGHTITEFNRHAAEGSDPLFGRGESLFNRRSGDPLWSPNPSLAPLIKPPFYALRVLPADIGTFAGLPTDEHARVLGTAGAPIDGLYAVGNDAATLFGGDYPAAGITLGPALTFGHVAARHALGAGWPANTDWT